MQTKGKKNAVEIVVEDPQVSQLFERTIAAALPNAHPNPLHPRIVETITTYSVCEEPIIDRSH